MIDEIVQNFWLWAKVTPEEYSQRSYGNEIDEFMYPQWDDLLNYARYSVDNQITNETELNHLFIIMAIDNEREEILDYITNNATEHYLNTLITLGANHNQFNTRWQIAELIRRRPNEQGVKILQLLVKDTNEYVRNRARYSLSDIK